VKNLYPRKENELNCLNSTVKLRPNVTIGLNCKIGDYTILGEVPKGNNSKDLETLIGDNAVIRSHTVIYAGNTIGRNFETGHQVMIREENKIGEFVSIGTGSIIEHHVKINDNVRLHSNVFIPEYCILEKECWIGPNVVLTNSRYPMSINSKENLKGVKIQKKSKNRC